MLRRGFVAGAAAAASLAGSATGARAQPTPAAAARVFLDYTQAELDRAFDQSVWAPNQDEILARLTRRSGETRRKFTVKSNVVYGASADNLLDIFPAPRPRAPLAFFVHGGTWRYQSKDDVSYLAETFVPNGAAFVAPSFSNVPHVRLPEMVENVRRAALWMYRNAHSFGADPQRMHLYGHSSGGHLAAMLMTTEWSAYGVPANIFKSAMCVSGLYDLVPVMLSARGSYLKLTQAEETALSPLRHLRALHAPSAIAIGERESPEFKRQHGLFADALAAGGYRSERIVVPALNHFEMLESLGDPSSVLGRAALAQLRVTG